MRRLGRVVAALVVCAVLTPVGAGAQPSPTPAASGGVPGVTAASAILVSLNDGAGRVIFARRIHDPRSPASLTKVMTALVARDEYGLDEVVTASPLVLQTHGSDLGLEPGMRITVRNLLYSLLLKSANDAGMALAAHHPLGYEHFLNLMNQKARSLGAYDSTFKNPHGLDQIGHVSSAWDMALFTRALLADPVLAAMVATKTHRMPWIEGRQRIFDNHNKLIGTYPGAIGVKTGFTAQAGHCLITAARTPNGIAFTVVMASQNHYGDSKGLIEYAKQVELRVASGGGGIDVGRPLALPPTAPAFERVAAGPALGGFDPRDDVRWLGLMIAIAVLTLCTLGFRRRSEPLREAAEAAPWLETLLNDRKS